MSRHKRPVRIIPHLIGAWACGLLVVIMSGQTAWAQFPVTPPTEIMFDDFETATWPRPPDDPLDGSGAIWDEWLDPPHYPGPGYPPWSNTDFTYYPSAVPLQVRGGIWGARSMYETSVDRNEFGYLVVKQSMPGNLAYVPADWTNIRIDVDLSVTRRGIPGIVWGLQDSDNDGKPNKGYLFFIRNFPTESQAFFQGRRARWELWRIDGENSWTRIDRSKINLPSTDDYTRYMVHYNAFRLRLEWFCGDLRVQVQRIYNTPGTPQRFYGCGTSCPGTDPEACWCTLTEWTEPGTSLTPGAAGIFHTGRANNPPARNPNMTLWDNFRVSAWPTACGETCDPWPTEWTEASTTVIPFKFLYESGLLDYSAGRDAAGSKIDVNSSAPATTSDKNSTTTNYCNGWNLLVDLPAPESAPEIDDIRAFLEPMASAVDYVAEGGGTFAWQDDFDNDPDSATYNPVPMIADGATPINNSLLDAYDWYVDQLTEGEWAEDPLRSCREWYVVLITDGAESCAGPNQMACDPGQSASKFANPEENLPPVKVHTIGFSEAASGSVDDTGAVAPEDLTCISDQTNGQYLSARNASELKTALEDVYNYLETEARSFSPFKISPPPSAAGPDNPTQDALVVYPIFQAVPKKSLWDGNLYGFRFNKDNRSIPNTGNCEIDFTQLVVEEETGKTWDASARLAEQLAAPSPVRHVFMSSDITGNWARHDLTTIPTNDTLRTEFKALLDVGSISDLTTQEVVNFVRGLWMDDDPSDPIDPIAAPRPPNSPPLGDIYHSQPVIVSPPNRSMYFFDYGFSASGVQGAHDYADFMRTHAKRRRVVLAGANDGMLHAFDGGIWDRNRTDSDETYDKIHDLGNGAELFAYVPQAVMPNLYDVAFNTFEEQQYMVDGYIEVGDAFIDHDGSGSREWRTVAIASMRRGGRGLLALDITQPDPITGLPPKPVVSDLPGCIDGSTPGCDGNEYPKVLWEFSDTTDEDNNCTETDCEPYWDLGWTWSKPVIARIAIYNSAQENEPDDIFVAFFGGGWDESFAGDRTGRHFYGVDVETGEIIVKHPIGAPVPGSPTALDTDDDGFHDRIYFADSDGSLWRLQYPAPNSSDATGAEVRLDAAADSEPGIITRIWDFRTSFTDRQMFFHRPVAVSTLAENGQKYWAFTLGSGNRADLGETEDKVDHFFFVLDVGDDVPRDASHLTEVSYADLDGSFTCTESALDPANATVEDQRFGWYLTLRLNEKVMWEAPVIDGYIEFPTFDPTPGVVADTPNQCGSEPDDGDGDAGDGDAAPEAVCSTSGIGRVYKLWYQCGLGENTESNNPVMGGTVYTDGSDTKTYYPTIDPDEPPEEHEYQHPPNYVVTNWRQY